MHKQKRGFTLVELLVVIAIIALLMSILMPALGRTKKQALAVACLARLHQWGLIFSLYTGKNGNFFHARRIGDPGPLGYGNIWIYTYKPYYHDPKMRYCPAAANDNRNEGPFGVWDLRYGSWQPEPIEGEGDEIPYGSYGMSREVVDIQPPDSTGKWRRADVKGADKIPVFMDSMYVCVSYTDNEAEPPKWDGDWTVGDSQASACINRHLRHVNVLFMDFSTRKVGLKELWSLRGDRNYDTCGPYTLCDNDGKPADDWPKWLKPYKDY